MLTVGHYTDLAPLHRADFIDREHHSRRADCLTDVEYDATHAAPCWRASRRAAIASMQDDVIDIDASAPAACSS